MLGKERICHFEEIEQVLARELGLVGGKLPDTTILYKDLDRFDSQEKIHGLKQVNDQVNARQLKDQKTVILDFDSSVETLYGQQEEEGAANGWSIPRRIVTVRTKEVIDEEQMELCPEYGWAYEWIVTNLLWEGEDIWRFYNHRCGMENYIKEAKNGFALDAISNDGFYPNAADALLKLIAYNVYQGFTKEVTPQEAKTFTVSRMRRIFWMIPAVLVSHARQWTLKLWNGFAKQDLWISMLHRSRQIE